ncbi:hypothetical protein Cs7R123_18580 [Catellatospora sp. TT07R-123]|uniref:alpha/beta hydrolase n=1 Tax=Catellatospora sp. TT07R-123 TaxID=2733863 RepID=UPI001B2B7CD9|nr:alpha/beta hydrolase [Catellatospora sp. TT07R-123]GHJ44516.1 hypothetical protein Cs7R123_18580 [Catellatospora sp. TT07R-123]
MAYDPATRRWSGDPDRVAVILPGGGGYSPDRPLLYYARAVLVALGWTVQEVWWSRPARLPPEQWLDWVTGQAEAALAAETAPRPLIVGKSLGTFAAPLAAARRLPAIWLTPILGDPDVASALAAATAPCLVVGGDADPYWKPSVAAGLDVPQLVLPGADHALEQPDDPIASARDLVRVTARMDEFLRTL